MYWQGCRRNAWHTCKYIQHMHILRHGIEYDSAKNAANQLKHGVDFAEAASCLHDPMGLSVEDYSEGEARWRFIGYSDRGRLLTVCYTLRGDVPRLISARKATSGEKAAHER